MILFNYISRSTINCNILWWVLLKYQKKSYAACGTLRPSDIPFNVHLRIWIFGWLAIFIDGSDCFSRFLLVFTVLLFDLLNGKIIDRQLLHGSSLNLLYLNLHFLTVYYLSEFPDNQILFVLHQPQCTNATMICYLSYLILWLSLRFWSFSNYSCC